MEACDRSCESLIRLEGRQQETESQMSLGFDGFSRRLDRIESECEKIIEALRGRNQEPGLIAVVQNLVDALAAIRDEQLHTRRTVRESVVLHVSQGVIYLACFGVAYLISRGV